MEIVRSNVPDFGQLWHQLFVNSAFQHPFYQPGSLRFYEATAPHSNFVDCSFLIEEKREPVVGVRLTYSEPLRTLSCFGIPLLYIESSNIPSAQVRGGRKILKVEMERILHTYQVDAIHYRDFTADGTLSFMGQYLLGKGALATPYLTQMINLKHTEAELYEGIRKSYKSLINWGKKNLTLRLLNSDTIASEDVDSFKALHFEVSGRKTRPDETWQLQHEMVSQKEAFIVLGNLKGEIVTAALYPCSPRHCFYGVAASKRELFNKPLSHAVMWRAIQYAKELGCCFLELGPQYYPGQHPEITQKELSISIFKHGFGGRTHTRLNIVWEREARSGK